VNLYEPTWDGEATNEDGATARAARLGRHAGGVRLGATLYDLEPGAAVSLLHFHHRNEELLLVLDGEPTLRGRDGQDRSLRRGEVVAFPAGPAGLHQVLNRTEGHVRVLICSTNFLPEIVEQPEAGVIAFVTEDGARTVPSDAARPLRSRYGTPPS
jgi:uncharacterized cupin superfamily protein